MKQVTDALLVRLAAFEATLREWRKYLDAMPPLPTSVEPTLTPVQAILEGDGEKAAHLLREHVMIQGQRFADLMASLPQLGRQPA